MSEGVFVVGMHRAGTSIATRLLGLLGLRLPVPEDLVPADARNPAGYWESMSLVALSERALRMVDSDARCPRRLAAGWERDPRLDELRREGRGAVRRAFGGVPWAWKDPRLCLAAAFWRSVIASERIPVVLLCRNPLEIAESAARADRPDGKLYTLALWERYLREALVQIGGLPVLVTRYDDLMRDPVRWCAEAASFLGRNGLAVRPADAKPRHCSCRSHGTLALARAR
ncbi:MAG: hypothetical protein KatS3mg012_0266 [Gaiellaceae bacterium]|nr:MAG: hypothetical protein KatS3mg012_0266 [Gaiellaceae bacterium]